MFLIGLGNNYNGRVKGQNERTSLKNEIVLSTFGELPRYWRYYRFISKVRSMIPISYPATR